MSAHPDWDCALENVAYLVSQNVLSVEEGKDLFEDLTGFRPDTGKPSPWWKRFRRWLNRV